MTCLDPVDNLAKLVDKVCPRIGTHTESMADVSRMCPDVSREVIHRAQIPAIAAKYACPEIGTQASQKQSVSIVSRLCLPIGDTTRDTRTQGHEQEGKNGDNS